MGLERLEQELKVGETEDKNCKPVQCLSLLLSNLIQNCRNWTDNHDPACVPAHMEMQTTSQAQENKEEVLVRRIHLPSRLLTQNCRFHALIRKSKCFLPHKTTGITLGAGTKVYKGENEESKLCRLPSLSLFDFIGTAQ